MNAVKKLLYTIWPSVLWTAFIFIGLSIPGSEFPPIPTFPHFDKLVHAVLFAVLAFFWCYYLDKKQQKVGIIIGVFLVCVIYGILMEYYQKCCVAFRGFEVADMLADGAGALLGAVLYKKNWPL